MAKINVNEKQIRQIIAETAKKVLMESGYEESAKKQAYLKITHAIDEFKNFLETTYDLESPDSECGKLWEECDNLSMRIDDFFRHPDLGGSYKTWDSAGF